MFNTENIGRKIAELRKNRNMTQLELADKMGISFQAVSNWERGNSMPDISKLPELAGLFEVTIDELLGEHSEIVNTVVNGDMKGYMGDNDKVLNEIIEIAPMLKPNQVNEILDEVNVTNLHDMKDLLPFVSSHIVDKLAMKQIEAGNYDDLHILAPFLSQNVTDHIAHKMIDNDKNITTFLPFISSHVVDKLAMKQIEADNYDDLHTLAPFLSQNVIDHIARKMVAKGKNITTLLPFISSDTMGELASQLYQNSGLTALNTILPFIPQKQLEQIADEEYASQGLCTFTSIAPFLSHDYLNNLAQMVIKKEGIQSISNIIPFLDSHILSEYIEKLSF